MYEALYKIYFLIILLGAYTLINSIALITVDNKEYFRKFRIIFQFRVDRIFILGDSINELTWVNIKNNKVFIALSLDKYNKLNYCEYHKNDIDWEAEYNDYILSHGCLITKILIWKTKRKLLKLSINKNYQTFYDSENFFEMMNSEVISASRERKLKKIIK